MSGPPLFDEAMGGCLCGAVHVKVTLPSNWVAHCHCTRCQRAHGNRVANLPDLVMDTAHGIC